MNYIFLLLNSPYGVCVWPYGVTVCAYGVSERPYGVSECAYGVTVRRFHTATRTIKGMFYTK